VPVSNPVLDGYFVHTVSRFLDLVDDLKSAVPLLGEKRTDHYITSQGKRFPDNLSSVAAVTRQLAEHCQGMPIWAHPNAQINVIPATTILSPWTDARAVATVARQVLEAREQVK